jgi:hypothetical protein
MAPLPTERDSASPGQGSPADETLLDELARMTPEERGRWNDRMIGRIVELLQDLSAGEEGGRARRAGDGPN